MDFNTAKRAIDLLSDKPLKIQFAGGEPLLNVPLIEQILDYASEKFKGVQFSIQTNGTLLDDDVIRLLKRHEVAIGVSLDGKLETNERSRGGTQGAVNGIRLLREHGVTININTVVSAANVSKLRDMVDLALYFGNVHGIGLDLLRNSGRAAALGSEVSAANGEILRDELRALYEYLKKTNAASPRKIVIREFEKARALLRNKTPGEDYCYAAQGNSYVVLPSGDCYPCGGLAHDSKYFMGNVYSKIKPLAIRCGRPAECADCRYAVICPGGCPARGLLSGGFDRLDCVMKKTTFELLEEDI